MTKIMPLLLTILFVVGCEGTVAETRREAQRNRQALFSLNVGMTKDQVLTIMGKPRKKQTHSFGDRDIEFWLYLTEGWTIEGSDLQDSHFTPLAFEKGTLIGWGRTFYERTLRTNK